MSYDLILSGKQIFRSLLYKKKSHHAQETQSTNARRGPSLNSAFLLHGLPSGFSSMERPLSWPRTPSLIVSGYTEPLASMAKIAGYVHKPFDAKELITAMCAALDRQN